MKNKLIILLFLSCATTNFFAQQIPRQIQLLADSLFCTVTISNTPSQTILTFEGFNYKTSSIFIDTIHCNVSYPTKDTTAKGEFKTAAISHKSNANLHATKTLFEIKTGKRFTQTVKLKYNTIENYSFLIAYYSSQTKDIEKLKSKLKNGMIEVGVLGFLDTGQELEISNYDNH